MPDLTMSQEKFDRIIQGRVAKVERDYARRLAALVDELADLRELNGELQRALAGATA